MAEQNQQLSKIYECDEGSVCVLSLSRRNKSSCSKIAMRLTVLRPDEVLRGVEGEPPVAAPTSPVVIHLQEGGVLDCPDLRDVDEMADSKATVTWLHVKPDNLVIQRTTKAPSCSE